MRSLASVSLLFGTSLLCLAETPWSFAQTTDPRATADQTDSLRVAPNAPRTMPEARSDGADGAGRADICEELVAFVQNATADAANGNQADAAKPSPAAPPAQAANASPDRSQRQSGISAPVPNDDAASRPTALSPEEVQSLAGARDLRGCQRAAQQMRRAGISLPPGLLALAALREDLLLEISQSRP